MRHEKFTKSQQNLLTNIDWAASEFDGRVASSLIKRGIIELVYATSIYGDDYYRLTQKGLDAVYGETDEEV